MEKEKLVVSLETCEERIQRKKSDFKKGIRKKYNMTLKDLSNKEIDEIMKEAPDAVLQMSQEVQDKYLLSEAARRRLDECPDRWFTFESADGEVKTIDLKQINIQGMIKVRGGSDEDVRDAHEIKKERFAPLIREYAYKKRAYIDAYKREKDVTLPPDHWNQVVQLFGEMNGIEDVRKIMQERNNVFLSQKDLLRFFAKNKAEIDARRATFLASSDQYKIASEAGRLQILNEILVDLHIKYQYYMEQKKEQKAMIFSREIRNILEQARKEVKGNELKLTVDGKIDITATLHGQENIDRMMRTLPINSIVVGIVAAKSNIDPAILIAQLASSYYKNFNGFNKNVLGREKIMLPGDTIRACNDWTSLAKLNQKFLEEMREMPIEEATFTEIKKKETIKERLERLRKIAEDCSK